MSLPFPTCQLTKLGGHNAPVHAVTYSSGLGQYVGPLHVHTPALDPLLVTNL